MFLGLFQKDLFKGRRMKFEAAFFQTKLLLQQEKKLTFTDEQLPLHVLVGYKQKMKAKALIGRLQKHSGMSSTKSLSKSTPKNFLSGKVSSGSL